MVWGDEQPIDSLRTQQLPQVDTTMAFQVVGDEDLAAMGPTKILTDQPAKHLAAHRRPPREVLTWPETAAAAVVLSALVVGAVCALSGTGSPGPQAVRQAAPETPVATTSLTPTAKPTTKHPVVRPAEPVVLRSERPALPMMPSPVHTVTVTVTAKPPATLTPKPTASSHKPTTSPTPGPTSPGPVEPSDSAAPDVAPTPDPEADRG